MLSFSPHYPQNTRHNAQAPISVHTPPRQPSPAPLQVPRRTDSLSSNIAKPKPTSPLIQAKEDAKFARVVLNTPVTQEKEGGWEERERELIEMLSRMTNWVEELGSLLQRAYKNQTELETALTLTRSNLQLALANNEMLEEALKRAGGNGKDVGWRRWSEREGVRRSGSVKDYDRPSSVSDIPSSYPSPPPPPPPPPPSQLPPPPQQQQQQQQPQSQQSQQSGPSRFFGFKSPLGLSRSPSNSSATSPTSTSASASASSLLPSVSIPSRGPSPSPFPPPAAESPREKRLADELAKERASKAAMEDELESLSQALFEEANKMVSLANRKLAETEEELRIARDEKEALKGALRIVEGERESLVSGGSVKELDTQEVEVNTHSPVPLLRGSAQELDTQEVSLPLEVPSVTVTTPHDSHLRSFWSPITPAPESAVSLAPSTPSEYSVASPTPSERSIFSKVPASEALLTPKVDELFPRGGPPASTSALPSEATLPRQQQGVNGTTHRWSKMPYTPRSRDAVRTEFEDAMRRMQDLVEGGEDVPIIDEEVSSSEASAQLIRGGNSTQDVRSGVSTGGQSETASEDQVGEGGGADNPWTT